MESLDELEKVEEAMICLIEKHEHKKANNITSYLTYHKLSLFFKKLDSETSKLKNIVSLSNPTISSIEKKIVRGF